MPLHGVGSGVVQGWRCKLQVTLEQTEEQQNEPLFIVDSVVYFCGGQATGATPTAAIDEALTKLKAFLEKMSVEKHGGES
jgi:hypothetical protein